MAFSSEFKNQVISQILSNELTISAAHREYSIGKSTVHNWLKQVKAGVSNNTNLRAALAAEGHCQILGFDSPETGQFCRSHGITLEELKEFSSWINANEDIVPAEPFRKREKELTQAVAELRADNLVKDKAMRRQEKVLAEAAALLILSKKAQAIWGDKGE